MTTADVEVRVGLSTGASSFCFRCPRCRLIVTKPAPERVLGLLMAAGSQTVAWALPAELTEPKYGPALTPDDLWACHVALESDAYLSELAELAILG